jgi:isopentenyldiphosphate isomerase
VAKKVIVVDENDKVIGEEDKKTIREKGLICRIVRILVLDSDGNLFLQKRGPLKETWPNCWDQSVGGHVETGESYYQAAVRETKEELRIVGVKLKEIEKFYLETPFDGFQIRQFNMLYTTVFDGEIKVNDKEISAGEWFEKDYLENWIKDSPEEFVPACIETIKRYWKFESKLGKKN